MNNKFDACKLMCEFYKNKNYIILSVFFSLIVSFSYAYFTTPVYRAKAIILPPKISDLAGYNNIGYLATAALVENGARSYKNNLDLVKTISTDEAYKIFQKNLTSESVRKTFFNTYYYPYYKKNGYKSDADTLFSELNKRLELSLPKRPGEMVVSITLDDENQAVVADFVNEYLALALNASHNELKNNIDKDVQTLIRSVEEGIVTARGVAKMEIQEYIKRALNALDIAEKLGLEEPVQAETLIIRDESAVKYISGFQGVDAMYLKGAKALRAEIEKMQENDDFDAYAIELPSLLAKKEVLEKINNISTNFSLAAVDSPAVFPNNPIHPKKMLILFFGLIFGLMLGLFLVLARVLFK
ncbi:MAG: GNVR domain-containing protein [Alcaligenes nematophilus]|uniref:GNVR domain-containing protein n=1 Tax=Alcaligenes nematophilus TaxID=2994643 RepID=UPI003CFC88B1